MSKDKLIPEIRFPEFRNEGEWNEMTLDNVVKDFIVPMRDKPKNLDGEIPWCRIEDFKGMYLSGSKSNQGVSIETIKEMNLKVYPVNTLLVSCSADLGRCAITQIPLITNQTFIGLVPDIKKVDSVYLYFLMTYSRNELNARSSGTTISYLSRQQFEKFDIILPKLNEQQKIASCLSSLDEVIAAHSQKLDLLKDHKKGLMQNLFPQEGETVPKYRFKEFENDGEWVENVLGEICDVRDGTHDSPKYVSNGYPMITSKNLLTNGLIDFENITYIKEEDYININKRSKVDINDILFGMIGTIGNPVIVKTDGFAIKNVALIKSISKLNQEFLLHQLKSNYILNQFDKVNAGGILKFIALGVIRNLSVIVPSDQEQQKIASCLSSLDALITAQAEKIEQLKLHKKGLMQGLFPKIND